MATNVELHTRSASAADTSTLIHSVDATFLTKLTIPAVLRKAPHLTVASATSYNKEYATYVCDGTADDVQIQAAVDAMPTLGGTVELLEGTFELAQTVLIETKGVRFKGQGIGTILEPTDNFADDTHMVKVLNDANTNTGVVVEGLRFNGSNTTFANTVHGLFFCSEVGIVDDVRVWQMSGDAMWVRNNVADNNVSKARFSRLDLAACGRHGMYIISGDHHFSDCIFRANRDSNFYGSMAGGMVVNSHFFASTENKAGTQTFYNLHVNSMERNYFTNCKFEHGYKSPVWLDGDPSGGKVVFVNCCVRDGSGEGDDLHPQVKITRAGGAFWNVAWIGSRFDADHGEPSWNIEIAGGAVRNGRFQGNTYADANVGTITAFTTTGVNGIGYRSTNENLGVNAGDPNSVGDWYQSRTGPGTRVWDTVNSKIWTCRTGWTAAAPAGVWVADS